MKFLTANRNLLLLAFLPTLAIVVFAFITVQHALKTLDKSDYAIKLIELSLVNNALVHEVQKERGMSNVYFYSQGQQFAEQLVAQRKLTNIALVNRNQFIEQQLGFPAVTKEIIALVGIKDLASQRNGIDEFALSSKEIIYYYSQLNKQLIDTILQAIKLSSDAAVNNLLHAYYSLVMSKEFAGIERAYLADIDSAQGFTARKLTAITRIRAMEESHLALFEQLAEANIVRFYQQAIQHESFAKIAKLRQLPLNSIESDTWFSDATQRINQLQALETEITANLLTKLNKLNSSAHNRLWFSVVYGALSIVLILILVIKLLINRANEHRYQEQLEAKTAALNLFKLVVDNSLNGVVITTPEGKINYVNKHFCSMSGYREEELIGKNPRMWSSGDTSVPTYRQLYTTITQGNYWQGELQNKRKDSQLYWTNTTIFPVKSQVDEIVNFVCIQKDVTQQKHDKETIEHLVNHDTLTGLPSLRLGKDRLEQAILSAQRHNLVAAVMFIDLDGFKEVNDQFGHAAGDHVLITTGQRIVAQLRQTDTVARIGGDEFIVVMTNIKHVKAIEQVAKKVIEAVKQPVYFNEHALYVTASIGISQYPRHGTTGAELLAKADQAMYAIKGVGKNNYSIYAD